VPRLRMSGVITPLPQYAFKAWCLVKKGTGTPLLLSFLYYLTTLFHYPTTCLEELRKSTKPAVRLTRIRTDILTRDLSNMKQGCQSLDSDVQWLVSRYLPPQVDTEKMLKTSTVMASKPVGMIQLFILPSRYMQMCSYLTGSP